MNRSTDQWFPWLVSGLSGPLVLWSMTGTAGLTAASLVVVLDVWSSGLLAGLAGLTSGCWLAGSFLPKQLV